MSKVTYQLDGLGCANCAAKIESAVKKVDGIQDAYVDFSTAKLVFSYNDLHTEPLSKADVEQIVHTYEPDVNVHDDNSRVSENTHDDFDEKREKWRLIISLLTFFMALFLKASLPTVFLTMLIFTYVLSGYKVIHKSLRNIVRGQWFDENFLMFIATVGAIAIGEYTEAVAVMLFYEVGEFFQDMAVGKSRRSISALINIRPEIAHVKTPNGLEDKRPEFVAIDEVVLVRPGERVPLDGVIVKGETSVDVSALTGESVPNFLTTDDPILSGSVVINGVIEVRITKRYQDSTVSKILELVQNATAHKAPTENFITKFARYYTPIVVGLAVLIVAIPTFIYGVSTFSTWLNRGLIFLVISCPCALVISVPLGFFSGIGNASHHGILIKGSHYLEGINLIDTVVFDKTGTLTTGKLEIVEVITAPSYSKEEVIAMAQKIESHSNHPIAKAILNYQTSASKNTPPSPISSTSHNLISDLSEKYEEIGGLGLKAFFDQSNYLAGTEKLMEKYHIDYPKDISSIGTRVYIAKENVYVGTIILKDSIKEHASELIHSLHKRNIKTIMLTGDRPEVAGEVAAALNIDQFYASLLPEDKFNHVQTLIKQNRKVAFVGDGINDAPVLASATLGISMGRLGSDAAIEASDIVIMNDGLTSIHEAFAISKFTKRIVMQNIVLAIGIKLVIMLLGTVGLSSMWMAIFADVGVALLAVLNAMRILGFKPITLSNLTTPLNA